MQARQLFQKLPALVDVDVPDDKHFTVCGDVHGQYYDVLNIWELNGLPGPDNPYLFNGECAKDCTALHCRTLIWKSAVVCC